MYFIRDVSPIHMFPSTIIVQKNLLHNLIISYHCVALVLKFEVDVFVYLPEYHQFLQTSSILHWRNVLHKGNFQPRHGIN